MNIQSKDNHTSWNNAFNIDNIGVSQSTLGRYENTVNNVKRYTVEWKSFTQQKFCNFHRESGCHEIRTKILIKHLMLA